MSVTSVLRELLFSQRADHRGPGGAPHESDCALASEGKGPRPRPRPRPLDKAAGMQIAVHVVKGDAYAQDRTYVHAAVLMPRTNLCHLFIMDALSLKKCIPEFKPSISVNGSFTGSHGANRQYSDRARAAASIIDLSFLRLGSTWTRAACMHWGRW